MSSLVWLASYPKSGNTWFRMTFANLCDGGTPIDINDLSERHAIASSRWDFDHVTLIESGLLSQDEAEALRPCVHAALADEVAADPSPDPRLVKAHDAFIATAEGEWLMGAADAAILIVRDPRAVAGSLASHRRTSIDAAIEFMGDPNAAISASLDGQPIQLRQRLLDWSGHAASWLDQAECPTHLVRYEDMRTRPLETLLSATAFLGLDVAPERAQRAIDLARFDRLQAQERATGFREWRAVRDGEMFFRRGESDAWRDELTAGQIARIELAHGAMMGRLGYAPVSAAKAPATL